MIKLAYSLAFPSGLALIVMMLGAVLTGPRWFKFRARFRVHRVFAITAGIIALFHAIITIYVKFAS
jgi:hypothetical protein